MASYFRSSLRIDRGSVRVQHTRSGSRGQARLPALIIPARRWSRDQEGEPRAELVAEENPKKMLTVM